MVATLAQLTDPSAAAHYYEADDYYMRDAKGLSQWHGKGARELGLDGEVDPEAFVAVLSGKLPNGTALGTTRDGRNQHKPGWDITFNAPKSVSVAALVAGDQRLIDAHNSAVLTALDYAERHSAVTRVREDGKIKRIATQNFVIATFQHRTARETDELPAPHLHTHGVISNATLRGDGQWRSLESQPLYKLQMEIGAVYHQELAAQAMRLGYEVTIAADSTFALDDVPLEVSAAFSSRSAQIEAELAKRGQTRATACAAEKATIALDTRAAKKAVNHSELTSSWLSRADELGFTDHDRKRIVAEAEARSINQAAINKRAQQQAADKAVTFARQHISEREAVFSAASLERQAGDAVRGQATHAQIVAAIARAERQGVLVARSAPRMAAGLAGFATREGIATERRMLAQESEGRNRFKPLHEAFEAARIVARAELASADQGHAWTRGQRSATKGLLQSGASVIGVQGSAGTAKTTTVLATYAAAARKEGLEVRAFAPTATAAAVLGKAVGAEPTTVARLLTGLGDDVKHGREAWMVDEASMLSARDAEALLALAHNAKARLILVGDVKQLGSVQAGRAFGQLQQAGMPTFVLDEIVRQTNEHTREAVEAMLSGDAALAFDKLDQGGGSVLEQPDEQARISMMARDFAALCPEDRAATLVLDPTREGRRILTDAIRKELVKDGTLGSETIIASVLEPRGLTRAQAASAASYTVGDTVTFRGSGKGQLRRGVGYRIEDVDVEAGTVRLSPPKGRPLEWEPGRGRSADAEVYGEVQQEFRVGDKLQFTRNNYGDHRLNGSTALVLAVDPIATSLMIQKEDGEQQTLDFSRLADRHVRPGWVRTVTSAQGATADRVMAHLESFRANTVDARSAYVAISRARLGVAVYTDSRAALIHAVTEREGSQLGAIDELMMKAEVGAGVLRVDDRAVTAGWDIAFSL